MNETETIFTNIYLNNSWNGDESKSGPGSSINITQMFLTIFEKFVNENGVKTILDLGCGDFNWMKNFNFNLIDNYLGIDIVKPMIDLNKKLYDNNKISFKCQNIIDFNIQKYDLILCKDVLFHLCYSDSLSIINNIKKSCSTFFVSTTFYDFINIDIKNGQWRPINLENEPFMLYDPIIIYKNIENKKETDIHINKSIGIWKIT